MLCTGDVHNPSINDPLYGQYWTWRSQDEAIVFDSIEAADYRSQKNAV